MNNTGIDNKPYFLGFGCFGLEFCKASSPHWSQSWFYMDIERCLTEKWCHGFIREVYTTPLSTLSINKIIYEKFHVNFMVAPTILCHIYVQYYTFFRTHWLYHFFLFCDSKGTLFSQNSRKMVEHIATVAQIPTPNLKMQYVLYTEKCVRLKISTVKIRLSFVCLHLHRMHTAFSSTWVSPPFERIFPLRLLISFFCSLDVFVSFMSHRLVYNATIIEKYYKLKWVLLCIHSASAMFTY